MHSWLRETVAQKQDLVTNTSNCNQQVHNSHAVHVLISRVGYNMQGCSSLYVRSFDLRHSATPNQNVAGTTRNRVTVRVLN